jgi:hypothetical protein
MENLDQSSNRRRVDEFLITAEQNPVAEVICFNKNIEMGLVTGTVVMCLQWLFALILIINLRAFPQTVLMNELSAKLPLDICLQRTKCIISLLTRTWVYLLQDVTKHIQCRKYLVYHYQRFGFYYLLLQKLELSLTPFILPL